MSTASRKKSTTTKKASAVVEESPKVAPKRNSKKMSDTESKKGKRKSKASKDEVEMEGKKTLKKNKITIRAPKQEPELFDPSELDARVVEEKFQLVRIHLEGNDHTVHFPNHTTGKFDNVQGGVIYTIYGHPYVADEVWKSRANLPARSTKQEMVKVPVEGEIHSGKLKLRRSRFLRPDLWKEYFVVLKFARLECYENKGDEKPVKTLELQWEDDDDEEGVFSKCWAKITKKEGEGATPEEEEEEDDKKEGAEVCIYKEKVNAFEVQTDDGDWQLQAQNYQAREEWMSWIAATAVFNEKQYAKQEARKLPKEKEEPTKKKKKEKAEKTEKRKSTGKKEKEEEKMEEIPLDDAEKKKKRKSKREE